MHALGALAMTILMNNPDVETRFLNRPEGRVAYETHGESGAWVICVPGMGDVRAQFRFMVKPLVDAGFRVALMDLRGLGQSDTSFKSYSAAAVGDDIVALIDELHADRAIVIGNSMAAAATVWTAA